MLSRREFLRMSLRTSTLVALAPTIPSFLAQTAHAMEPMRDGRILVVVQLNGGNDGINTVVPFADEGYAKGRKVLRLPGDRLHKVTKEIALHPAMGEAAKLLEDGRLAIVQGVGYPNPNRSHFKSMATWHTANVKLPKDLVQFNFPDFLKRGSLVAPIIVQAPGGWHGSLSRRGRNEDETAV